MVALRDEKERAVGSDWVAKPMVLAGRSLVWSAETTIMLEGRDEDCMVWFTESSVWLVSVGLR